MPVFQQPVEDYIYFALTLAIGLLAWRLLSRALRQLEERRAARIERIRQFGPVRTSGPVAGALERSRREALDNLGTRFSIIRKTLLAALFVVWLIAAAVPFFGDVSTGMISLFGAGGAVLLGIAARPLLESVIAGYVVTFSQQFRTGDTVLIDDLYGTIEDITPTHTVIKLWDWRRYIVPNSVMLTKEVVNYTNRDHLLWARLVFHVAHDADLDLVRETAVGLACESRFLAGTEKPQFWIMSMEKDAVECWLAMWTESPADAWSIRVEVAQRLVGELSRLGIKTHAYQINPAGQHPGATQPPSGGTGH